MNLACCAARKPSGTKNLFGQKDDGRANKECSNKPCEPVVHDVLAQVYSNDRFC